MSALVEVVACTVDDCLAAERGGAGRIELCSAISEGGLTPSLGTLLEARRRVSVPIVAMVRPRGGGFGYSEAEFDTMRRDAELLAPHADGLVVGMLTPEGDPDPRLEAFRGPTLVCHRAFDVARDPLSALESLIGFGFRRVLTSGGAATALEGASRLRELRERAAGRIEVLAGGGVRSGNVAEVVRLSQVDQVHLGPFRKATDAWSRHPAMSQHLGLDEDEVRRTVQALGTET